MDSLRAIQLIADVAYLLLGIAAIRAAVRAHERARLDVALLFGSLAVAVAVQEVALLSCGTSIGCIAVPGSTQLTVIAILILPWALLRLVDDVADVPPWQMWLTLVVLVALSVMFIIPGGAGQDAPGWLVLVLLAYLVLGTVYTALAFVRRASTTVGLTRRRMIAIASGCGLLALTFVIAAIAAMFPHVPGLIALERATTLVSGLCFWAGFFPPGWLSQAWRSPELLDYLRPTRLMAAPVGDAAVVGDAMAIDRLVAATDRTTGARRTLLILEDREHNDLYLWGAPSARIEADHGVVGRAFKTDKPLVVSALPKEDLPSSILAVFASETLPRTAIFVPIGMAGRVVGVLAAFADKGPMFVDEDLTIVRFFAAEAAAILHMQRLRETANELEVLREADRLKDEFMAVVSHELRTPLTAISGYSDILLRKLSGALNERQERQVGGIRDAARRLLSLINDLLDVSKLEAGTLDLHLAPLDAHAALERAVSSTRVIAATKGVLLNLRAAADDIPPVSADEDRVQQILTNLLVNAIKFTPQAGQVTADVRCETGQIVFQVTDTGVGLAPGQVERIWDRFYQAESTSTRRFGGAGLGLSIVRRLAELHGGRAEASSAGVGQGSTFLVRLPVAAPGAQVFVSPPAQVETPPPTRAPLPNGSPLVLVVEDDAHIATVLRTYLEADGYAVEVVPDGQQAIQAARTLSPFAITLDISLPKLDGWSVLNALKREHSTSDIPVVIVSIVDNRDFGLVLGASEYIVKPIEHERLQSVLRKLAHARQADSGTILVVDDDPAVLDVLSNMLSDEGWRVATAADGDAALSMLARERPTAMLLDLMMPRVDGFTVLQTVREQSSTRDLPVVVLTAKELTEHERQRLSDGVQRVILKQALSMDELRSELRTVLDRHRAQVA